MFKKKIDSKFILLLAMCISFQSCKNKINSKAIADNAFSITKDIVAIGPRVSASPRHLKVQQIIESYVSKQNFKLNKQNFIASTPLGRKSMSNLYFTVPGQVNKKILIAAHYDSKHMPEINFVGANDAASSVALILALLPTLKKMNSYYTYEIVFFDGEEAFKDWTKEDSLYGSRHFAKNANYLKDIDYAVVMDMISDKDLKLVRSYASDKFLMSLLETTMQSLKLSYLLDSKVSFIEDDHIPLVRAGVPTLHLMDFTFGSSRSPGSYWHTQNDSLENISIDSIEKVARITLGFLKLLNQEAVKNQSKQ